MSVLNQAPAVSLTNVEEISLDTSTENEAARKHLHEYMNRDLYAEVHNQSPMMETLKNQAPSGSKGFSLSLADASEMAANNAYSEALSKLHGSGAGALSAAAALRERARHEASGNAGALEDQYDAKLDDNDMRDKNAPGGNSLAVDQSQESREAIAIEEEQDIQEEQQEKEQSEGKEQEERRERADKQEQEQRIEEEIRQAREERLAQEQQRESRAHEEQQQDEEINQEQDYLAAEEQEELLLQQMLRISLSAPRSTTGQARPSDQVVDRDGRQVTSTALSIFYELQDFKES